MTHPIDTTRRLARPFGLALVMALAGGAAMAETAQTVNRHIIDALTARGFSDIEIDRTGSVIRVDAERRGIDYDFVYNPNSGKLTVRDDVDGRVPHQDAKRSRVVEMLRHEGFSNIEIHETGALVRGEAVRNGFEYAFTYNPNSGKLSVEREREVRANASANPGNGGMTGQARANEVRDDHGNNGRGNDDKGKDKDGKGNGRDD